MQAKVVSYAPAKFREVRRLFGLSEKEIIASLRPEANREQIFKSNQLTSGGLTSNNGGKSNSFFFFTQDGKFIVKTLITSERQIILQKIGAYVEHLKVQRKSGSMSLLAPIIGVFDVHIKGLIKVGIMVMKNQT